MRRVVLVCALVSGGCDQPSPEGGAPSATGEASATAAPSASAEAAPPPAPSVIYEREELPEADLVAKDLASQRAAMIRRMRALDVLPAGEVETVEAILANSNWLGQGNPDVVEHPMTRRECMDRRKKAGVHERLEARCGAAYMTPLYDPQHQTADDAKVCIDRYEFPGIPCEYPVTWVTSAEAQKLCQAVGKRLCDAHEWEGGCAGALLPPEKEYRFGADRQSMRGIHNVEREIRWAYGEKKNHALCPTQSNRSPKCSASGWRVCGSNTYPAGSFPTCRSPLGVYDQHGNAAEHMLLPLQARDLGAQGGAGVAEMKGSWFIFSKVEAHIDDCRWRAPGWHENEGRHHRNYHLGFRCCRDVP